MVTIYGSGKYKYGLCHVFAIALHHIFGYQIAILEDQDRVIENDKLRQWWAYIPHVFCIKGDYIIDACGIRKPSTMIRQSGKYPISHPKIHTISPRTLYRHSLYIMHFEKITKKNIKEAEEFILKHKSTYTIS